MRSRARRPEARVQPWDDRMAASTLPSLLTTAAQVSSHRGLVDREDHRPEGPLGGPAMISASSRLSV
jgi:hypothetical protein